ncbi:MAG: hypothetical protein FWE60_05665, partial [Oscillospiraceae bacterium]|nr:hypothetical protein [Oscillospiraceae bacterium]
MKKIKRLLSGLLSAALMLTVVVFTPGQRVNAASDFVNISSISNGEIGTDWSFDGTILTISDGADIEVTGSVSNGRRIVVEAGTADVTLNGVTISGLGNNQSAITLNTGATLNLTLTGSNELTG